MSKLVGILNVTPDSFSDGGKYINSADAFNYAKQMVKDGAVIIDVGAESTRPNAQEISHEKEWQRLEEVLKMLQPLRKKIQISLDTRHFQTAKKAMDIGIDWINDVSGFSDPHMIQAVKNSACKLVVMHNLGVPADKNITISPFDDPVKTVYGWANIKITELINSGIEKSRIIFDPGIGFGKTAEQSLVLIQAISCFNSLNVPLYVGHSRKSFLKLMNPDDSIAARDKETYTVSAYLAKQGVDYLRVHDIKNNLRAIKKIS